MTNSHASFTTKRIIYNEKEGRKLLTVQQVKSQYGWGFTTIYKLMKTELTKIKIGRRTYLKVEELDALVDRCTVKPKLEEDA